MGFHRTNSCEKTAITAGEISLPTSLLTKFKAREHKLQILPAVAVHAMELAKNPDCPISEFASVVELDMKLAADILKIANSAAYNPTVPIKSLKQAVVRLGMAGCQSLIITSSYASLLKRLSVDQERICTTLWKHSYDTALLSKYLNETFHLGYEGEEFASGLIHDFGRVLLAIIDPEKFAEADHLDFNESSELLKKEEVTWGIDHCRFGAWYAQRQKLPHPIPEVVLRHHVPEKSITEERLVSLISVADHMANHLLRYETAANYDPMSNPSLHVLAGYGDAQFREKYANVAQTLMDRALKEGETVKTIFKDVVPTTESVPA